MKKSATAEQTIEAELLEVTGEKKQAKGEERRVYLKRVTKAANNLPEKKWDTLSQEAQTWVNDGVENINTKQPLDDFPDIEAEGDEEDDEEEKPAKKSGKKPAAEEDDEDDEGDDEDDEGDDDEEEEKPVKKAAAGKGKPAKKEDPEEDADEDDDDAEDADEDDEDDEEPAPLKKRGKAKDEEEDPEEDDEDDEDEEDADEEEEEEPAKKSGKKTAPAAVKEEDDAERKPVATRIRELVVKHTGWKKDKVLAQLTKEGYKTTLQAVSVPFYDTRNTLKIAEKFGLLKDDVTIGD